VVKDSILPALWADVCARRRVLLNSQPIEQPK